MKDSGRSLIVAENPQGRGPFVILCDHASNRIPDAFQSFGFAEDALQTHIAWTVVRFRWQGFCRPSLTRRFSGLTHRA